MLICEQKQSVSRAAGKVFSNLGRRSTKREPQAPQSFNTRIFLVLQMPSWGPALQVFDTTVSMIVFVTPLIINGWKLSRRGRSR